VQHTADGVELSVTGDLDLSTADTLVETATALIVDPPRTMVVDLAGVPFCDSTGLSGLIKIRNMCDAAGWVLEIHNLRDQVAQVVKITGLGAHLNVDGGTGLA
jgi:anti-sigma B factor antagonist